MAGARDRPAAARAEVSDALGDGRRRAERRAGRGVGPAALLGLQRAAGNSAVNALLAARMRFPGEDAVGRIDAALREVRTDEPAIDVVEKGLREAQAVGIPVELEGPKPPASALAVTKTGFGPEQVPQRKPTPPPKPTPAVSPLGKAAARRPAAHGGAPPSGRTAAPSGPGAGAGPGHAPSAPLTGDQLLQPPAPPEHVAPGADPAFTAVTAHVKGFAARPSGRTRRRRRRPRRRRTPPLPPTADVAGQAKAAKVDTMDAQPVGGVRQEGVHRRGQGGDRGEVAEDPQGGRRLHGVRARPARSRARSRASSARARRARPRTSSRPPRHRRTPSKAVPKPVTPMGPERAGTRRGDPGVRGRPQARAAGAAQPRRPASTPTEAELAEGERHRAAARAVQRAAVRAGPRRQEGGGGPRRHRTRRVPRSRSSRSSRRARRTPPRRRRRAVAGMQGSKAAALANLVADKGKAKSKDEAQRAEVTAKIQGIYAATETDVKKILDGIDPKVEKEFEAGEAAARKAFESYVVGEDVGLQGGPVQRLARRPAVGEGQDRSGCRARSTSSTSPAASSTSSRWTASSRGSRTSSAPTSPRPRSGSRAARPRSPTYVKSLPDGPRRRSGPRRPKEIGDRFAQLENDVDAKQDAVVDALATKYVEARKGLDERIEELQAENKGLVDKAIGAIKAVINTIRELASMLTNVLARVAGVVGDIIKAPIRLPRQPRSTGSRAASCKFKDNILDHLTQGPDELAVRRARRGRRRAAGQLRPQGHHQAARLDVRPDLGEHPQPARQADRREGDGRRREGRRDLPAARHPGRRRRCGRCSSRSSATSRR